MTANRARDPTVLTAMNRILRSDNIVLPRGFSGQRIIDAVSKAWSAEEEALADGDTPEARLARLAHLARLGGLAVYRSFYEGNTAFDAIHGEGAGVPSRAETSAALATVHEYGAELFAAARALIVAGKIDLTPPAAPPPRVEEPEIILFEETRETAIAALNELARYGRLRHDHAAVLSLMMGLESLVPSTRVGQDGKKMNADVSQEALDALYDRTGDIVRRRIPRGLRPDYEALLTEFLGAPNHKRLSFEAMVRFRMAGAEGVPQEKVRVSLQHALVRAITAIC